MDRNVHAFCEFDIGSAFSGAQNDAKWVEKTEYVQ